MGDRTGERGETAARAHVARRQEQAAKPKGERSPFGLLMSGQHVVLEQGEWRGERMVVPACPTFPYLLPTHVVQSQIGRQAGRI